MSDLISDGIFAERALTTFLLIVGIATAVGPADKLGRIKRQIGGFIGCALGPLLASFSVGIECSTKIYLIFAGFMLFSFMTHIGPNAQTRLLAGEVFPIAVCGMGAEFAAAYRQDRYGGIGIPLSDPARCSRNPCAALRITLIPGAIVTWLYRIEMTELSLDRIGR